MKLTLFLITFLFAQFGFQTEIIWVEDWSEGWQDRWTNVGYAYDCSHTEDNLLVQDCQSAALVSNQRFPVSGQITFTGSIYSQPAVNSSTVNNLAHHTLFGVDDGPNGQYCGIYLTYSIEKQMDAVTIISYPDIYYLGVLDHQTHIASIVWTPEANENGVTYGTCEFYLEDQLIFTSYYSFTVTELALWKGTNSVDPGSGNDGSISHAEHGSVTVTTTN